MKHSPKTGQVGELRFVVEQKHAIDFADEAMPPVLSTPWLVWQLEQAARRAIAPCLEPEERCVGGQIDIQHLASTPLGEEVVCKARVLTVAGSSVKFQVEAHDEHELIARGLHTRHVIVAERFARRVHKKQSGS